MRQILAANLANLVRRYCGTRRRDIRLEPELVAELDQSSRLLDGALLAKSESMSTFRNDGTASRLQAGVVVGRDLRVC